MPTLNELLHAASRTFAVGIDLLPEPLRGQVETAYLLLRVSDYLEDNETMTPERKAALLERWARVLEEREPLGDLEADLGPVEEPGPDALVTRNAAAVEAAFRALHPAPREIVGRHVVDSSRGMARWLLRGPDLADESDLDDYMHEVAGRVGWLLTELFALGIPAVDRRRAEMMVLGREFGLALQTVNVIRGLHEDWRRGWVYVPRSFVDRDVAAEKLFGGAPDPERERQVLARMVGKAERHLDAARRYILHLPRRHHGVRLFCLLPYLFAVRTLAVSRENPDVFRHEVKIGRDEVRRIVRDARLMGWSNLWLRRYARRLERTESV